jgi:Nif-specific regulatory protein
MVQLKPPLKAQPAVRQGREVGTMGRILVADDHDSLRRGLVRALSDAGHQVEEAPNGNVAIERLHQEQFDVVLSDLRMGGSDGMDVLRTAKALQPMVSVILMTAFGSVQTAVEAMKIGAFDYVLKPFEIEEMEVKIEKSLEVRRLKHEIEYLRHTQNDIYDFDRIVGASSTLQKVLDIVRKVAKSNTTVLIRGETGTGKELIAGAIHHNSLRAARNFVRVNCAALQENLLESELFGHEKGAFTGADKQRIGRFEQADGGSLFLDEVGDMSSNTQAKILRVLQEHEFERLGGTRTLRVDVRIIAATNRNLAAMVAAGQFREDLYYRLNVVSVETPPLRERKDDIPSLVGFFIRRFTGELKKKVDGLEPDALKLLMRYNWPGNIRELENTVERAILMAEGNMITIGDLRVGELAMSSTSGSDQQTVVKIPPTGIALEEVERQTLIEALKMSNWVQKDAAELLCISPRVMNYKIKTLNIDFPRGRRALAEIA